MVFWTVNDLTAALQEHSGLDMGRTHRQTILGQYIANLLGAEPLQTNAKNSGPIGLVSQSLAYGSMALLAVAPAPVGAVSLGEIELKSKLGQPLNATVPLSLRAGETLAKNCVQLAPPGGTALGAPPGIRMTSPPVTGPGTYQVRVQTANPLHEPMYELSLMVRCPGNPLLVRQYILMLDLPGMPVPQAAPVIPTSPQAAVPGPAPQTSAPPVSMPQASTPRAAAPRATPAPARALQRSTASIPAGSQYRVVKGDTLSTIARRIEGRLPDTTWPVADRIFADNPRAFVRNNPDLIKLGMVIRVPTLSELAALRPNVGRVAMPMPEAPQQLPDARPQSLPARESLPVTASHPAVPADMRATRPATPFAEPTTMTQATTAAEPEPTRTTAPDDVAETAGPRPGFSPFADDSFAANGKSPVSDAAPAADSASPDDPANFVATDVDVETGDSTSLMAVLLTLLLGGGISLLLLRRRLFAAFGGRRRRKAGQAPGRHFYDASNVGPAARTFEAEPPTPVKIGNPMEATYIVEMEAAESTVREPVLDLAAADMTQPDITEQHPQLDAEPDEDASTELARLFEDDYATAGADASAYAADTVEQPHRQPEGADPHEYSTSGLTSVFDSTRELPQQMGDDEIFDPSGGLPAQNHDEIFDPTAELPHGAEPVPGPTARLPQHAGGSVDPAEGPVNEMESTLMQAFTDDLTNIDADKMFATGVQVQSFDAPAADATAESVAPPAPDDDLDQLPNNFDEDGDLSETLHEALMLLERDFEDEFTASQIIEQSQLKASLNDTPEQEDETLKTRKMR